MVIRDVGVDGAGNWSSYIGRQDPNRRIEAQQYRVGRPWSGWTGTNVVERFVGLRFQFTSNRYHTMRVESGGHHQISWHWGVAAFNDRNIWQNYCGPQHGVWHEIRVRGDITAVLVQDGVNVQLLDFYNPGRGNPVYLKVNGAVNQVWNPVQ